MSGYYPKHAWVQDLDQATKFTKEAASQYIEFIRGRSIREPDVAISYGELLVQLIMDE